MRRHLFANYDRVVQINCCGRWKSGARLSNRRVAYLRKTLRMLPYIVHVAVDDVIERMGLAIYHRSLNIDWRGFRLFASRTQIDNVKLNRRRLARIDRRGLKVKLWRRRLRVPGRRITRIRRRYKDEAVVFGGERRILEFRGLSLSRRKDREAQKSRDVVKAAPVFIGLYFGLGMNF